MEWFLKRGGLWVVGQTLLLIAAFTVPSLFPSHRYTTDGTGATVLRIGGGLITISGCLMMLAGALALRRNLTPLPTPNPDSELVTTGIFGMVRHPIYGGLILVGIGAFLCDPTLLRLAFSVLLFLFFDAKSRYEEKRLAERFGPGTYERYAGRTRRLIPWLF